jgi:hypothetical protein
VGVKWAESFLGYTRGFMQRLFQNPIFNRENPSNLFPLTFPFREGRRVAPG